jgi:hypothetical protein
MPQKETTNSNSGIYVKLEDVLALIPEDDICGPKPSALRKKLAELPAIILAQVEITEEDDIK